MALKIEIGPDTFKNTKLFLATPMYGGQCAGMFARSVMDLSALSVRYRTPATGLLSL